jgi:hypothetical protein
MSLATLKRKTAAKYNNMSVGHANFSLNGTHRSQGYVGQNLRSESCMLLCTNDPNVVKSSVGGSSNHIQAKHLQSTRNGVDTVKPDSNHIQSAQHTYIENVRKTTINAVDACIITKTVDCPKSVNIIGAGGRPIFNTKPSTSFNSLSCYTTTKDLSGESKSSSSHIFKLANKCAENEDKPTNPIGGAPLPGTF